MIETSTSRVHGKRGRPRKDPKPKTNTRMINKIVEAINNHPGEPIMYASTTKGTMKLVVDGHHFRYSFRKGNYTIFQCCYKENKEECLVRVVTDQKLVYPLDGEHIHFVQAIDKSVTSVQFAPAGTEPERDVKTITDILNPESNQTEKKLSTLSKAVGLRNEKESDSKILPRIINTATSMKMESVQKQEQATVNMGEFIPRPIETNVKVENVTSQESLEHSTELASEKPTADNNVISTEEFREKIKKRLQKALLGKKK